MPPKQHDVLLKFNRWHGHVPEGFGVDFLGVKTRSSFASWLPPQPVAREEAPAYPGFDEEYFEWIDLLEAVDSARTTFAMLELGAGWGRWTARAAAACRQRGIKYQLLAVEAEPTHFAWLEQNMRDNEVAPENCRLIQAAIASKDGRIGFEVGSPGVSYGNAIGGSTEVDAVSLDSLLKNLNEVDLIDMDVQGAELQILSAASGDLEKKVKRIRVETHNAKLHEGIMKLLRDRGWKLHCNYAGNTADRTPWGRINFQEGYQTWFNAQLVPPELLRAPVLGNSSEWRLINALRAATDKFAPQGSKRRKMIAAPIQAVLRRYRRSPDHVARAGSGWRA
jgi:FkbM family methyltransferase